MSLKDSVNGITFSGVMQSLGLLLLRVGVAGVMLYGHGLPKLLKWGELYDRFSDPIGIGSMPTLALVVAAEVICSVLVALGLFSRVALIPLVIDMVVAFFVVHDGAAFQQRELALLFLIPFVTLLVTGPGWYSLDNIRKRRKSKRKAGGPDAALSQGPGMPFDASSTTGITEPLTTSSKDL